MKYWVELDYTADAGREYRHILCDDLAAAKKTGEREYSADGDVYMVSLYPAKARAVMNRTHTYRGCGWITGKRLAMHESKATLSLDRITL